MLLNHLKKIISFNLKCFASTFSFKRFKLKALAKQELHYSFLDI